ncbi:hypothetical protein T484DRAFT_1795473 [Baffinella frigidus]|nr:hypothetical protein T484DRAFT_1795473 [Cryptophyta sp. CCMP2293]
MANGGSALAEMLIAGAESVLSLEVRLAGGVFKSARLVEREGQRAVWQVGDVEVRVFFASGASSGGKRNRLEEADVWGGKAAKIEAAPSSPAASASPSQAMQAVQAVQVPPVEAPGNAPQAWAAGTVRLGADGLLTNAVKMKEGERSFKCGQCGKGFVTAPDLQKHTLVHTNERRYVCSTCDR